MTATVRPRPNHYEILGVSPAAADDEIARAFAREGSVFRPHAFGGLAELCIAYETLRDPIKRRAYDAAIGLKREPKPPNFVAGARQAVIAKAAAPLNRPAIDRAPPPAPQPRPALPLGPAIDSQARAAPRIADDIAVRDLEEALGAEVRPIDWRRTGITLGTVVVAACLLGGLAGWWSASAMGETSPPENAVSVSLPAAKPLATSAASRIAIAPVRDAPDARNDRPKPAVNAAAPVERTSPVPELAPTEEQPQAVQLNLSEQADGDAPTTSTVTAAMPLPDRVIARTIEQIGYSCGSVASTSPVAGEAPGVFKVTCSSGQSYQARPVNGRYHFRRWARR